MKLRIVLILSFILFFSSIFQHNRITPVSAENNCRKSIPIFSSDLAPSNGRLEFRVQSGDSVYRRGTQYYSGWDIQEGQRMDKIIHWIPAPRWTTVWWQPQYGNTWYLLPSQYWHNDGFPDDLYGVSCGSSDSPSYHTSFGSAIPEAQLLPDEQCPLAPVLVSPTNGATIDTLTPLFEWEFYNTENAYDFFVEVGKDSSLAWANTFTWHDYAINSNNVRFSSNLEPSTTYYWQAHFLCGGGTEARSEQWSFTTTGNQWLPEAPILTYPLDETNVSPNGVTLQWEPINGVIEYQLSWGNIETSSRWVPVTENSYYYLDSWYLESGSPYEWSVAARNEYGLSEFTTAVFTTIDQ